MKDIITRFYTLLQTVVSALSCQYRLKNIKKKTILFSIIGYIMYSEMYTHKYAYFTVHFQN